MKTTRLMIVLAAALAVGLGTLAPTPASADGGYRKPHYPAAGYRGHVKPKAYYPARGGGYYRPYYGGGSRYNFGFYLGPGFWGPYYPPYYGPYYGGYYGYGPYSYPYYPPAVVTVPSSPPQYVERGAPDAGDRFDSAYWYYCRDADAYYPYVKQCPGGWERVAPQPPPAR
jgi:hypothetical protein